MGRELADYAKKAGVKGLMLDELPAYGISPEKLKIHFHLDCGEKDAFILIFGNKSIAEDAMERVIKRVNIDGVPKE